MIQTVIFPPKVNLNNWLSQIIVLLVHEIRYHQCRIKIIHHSAIARCFHSFSAASPGLGDLHLVRYAWKSCWGKRPGGTPNCGWCSNQLNWLLSLQRNKCFYSEVFVYFWALHPVTKSKSRHPAKETLLGSLYQWSHSFRPVRVWT